MELEGEDCGQGGTSRPDPAAPGEADRVFTVCRDDSVVERAKFKEDKYRLGEEVQATLRPPYRGRDEIRKQTIASVAKLKAWGARVLLRTSDNVPLNDLSTTAAPPLAARLRTSTYSRKYIKLGFTKLKIFMSIRKR